MLKYIEIVGDYFLMLKRVFRRPEKMKIFWNLVMREIYDLGISSIGLVSFISFFFGAIISLQMARNFHDSALPIPDDNIGYATKVIIILEIAPTIVSVILAGKVGSYIASSIGTMRVTEQIDALEVIGVNAQSFLILPKIIAAVFFNPILVMIGIILGLIGGYTIGIATGNWATIDYLNGIQSEFKDMYYYYALVKTAFFAFVIATIPAYFGFNVSGGSLEVGRNSTMSVVWTCVFIFILNLIITQIWLG